MAANATNVPLAREEEGASWWSEMRIDEHMPPFRGSGRLKEWITCKCWVRSVLSSRPLYHTHSLAHSQRSKNGQSPGWKSCRVGLGKDSRYARSNGGFERCVYKYTRIHVYTCLRIIRVWCGSMGSSAVCRRCRETLAGICCSILSCASAVDLPTAVLPGVLHRRRCVVLFSNQHWWNSSSVLLEEERWMPIDVL